jgi:hypothetical protein
MGRRIVKKFHYQRMPFEHLLDDAALHPAATAVYETHLGEPGGMCFVDVLFDYGGNVSRGKRVQVEAAFDGNAKRPALSDAEGVLILHCYVAAGFS